MSSKWENRYAWIWYNKEEIFDYTEDMMREKVRPFAQAGINILIGFSCTHFRWSFYRYWDKITACIKMLASVCHEFGIKYIEHHSSQLTFNPQTPEDMEWLERTYIKGEHEAWSGVLEDTVDFDVDGVPVSSFRQISGKSGKYGITTYHGYGMCYNNPDYKKAYFRYLETLYEAGIDGIMTDDIQYFGNDGMGWKAFNACTCVHCRKKFREKTGYEIPSPEEWSAFYGDYNNPVYVAWKRFKDESAERFARDVTAHYKSLGYEMLRPNYISNILNNNLTAYPFERCADMWDCVFQENCTRDIMKESWGISALESMHRYHMASEHHVPAMAMYYPRNQQTAYFSWSLGVSSGLLCTFCSNGNDRDYDDKPFIDFHKKHLAFYDDPRKKSDCAFLLSQTTRDYAPSCGSFMRMWICWAQSALFSGISTDIVFENDGIDELSRHKIIVACCVAMPDGGVTEKLGAYVKNGGTLVIIGEFDKYGTDGQEHEPAEFAKKAGKYGNGSVILVDKTLCHGSYQDRIMASLPPHGLDTLRVGTPPRSYERLILTGGRVLGDIIGKKTVEGAGEGLTATLFSVGNGYALHLLNTKNKFSDTGDSSHGDRIYGFENGVCPMSARTLTVRTEKKISGAALYTPEREDGITLGFKNVNGGAGISIPENAFSGYALVKLFVE